MTHPMTRWDSLLAVQEHDTALDQLHHQMETLPERADLAATMDQLAELERVGTEVTDERQRIGRDQQRLEDEIASLTDKATNTDKLLYGGTVSNPRELQAMQDEIAALKRRIGQLEDRELELMEAAEPLDARLVEIIQKREAFDAQASSLRAAIAEAEVALGAEVAPGAVRAIGAHQRHRPDGADRVRVAATAPGWHRDSTAGRRPVRRLPPHALRC